MFAYYSMSKIFKKSLFLKAFEKVTGKLKPENYIFYSSIVFYLLLWHINPNNKIIALSFVFLIFIYNYKLKNVKLSILLTYLASSIIFTGKRYLIQLVPEGVFPKVLAPQGYVSHFVISYLHIIAFFMLILLVRDFLKNRMKFKLEKKDYLVIFYFLWLVLSDILGSSRPNMSILFSVLSLHFLVFYFYLKFLIKGKEKFIILIALFTAQIIFESYISYQQFIASSPIYKNIEAQVDIEYFGFAADEPQFRFRPVGTFNHANELGMAMSFWLLIIFAYLYKRQNILSFTALIFGVVTLAATLSRSSWLGFAFVLFFTLFFFEKVKKIKSPEIFTKNILSMAIVAVVVTIFFIFPRAEKSLYTFSEGGGYFRSAQIRAAIELIKQNPLYGVGTGMSVPAGLSQLPRTVFSLVPLGVHNWYLNITTEHGIPAILLFLALIATFMMEQVRKIWDENVINLESLMRIAITGGVVSSMIVGMFQPFVGETFILLAFAILGKRK